MKKAAFILILFCAQLSFAQASPGCLSKDDSLRIKKAREFLDRRIGAEFRDSIFYSGSYHSILRIITFDIKSGPENYKNTIAVFFDGLAIDTVHNTKINAADLKNFYAGMPSEHLLINRSHALALARKSKLPKGMKEWECSLKGVMDKVSWEVRSVSYENPENPFQAGGSLLEINARTEKQALAKWLSNS